MNSSSPEDRGTSGAASTRSGWKLKVPAVRPRLEDALLLTYRHPHEKPALALSIVVLAAVLMVGAQHGEWKIIVGIAGLWLSMVVTASLAGTHNMLRGAEVTPTQFSALYQIVQQLSQRFNAPSTRVFVMRKFSTRAETVGFMAPYVIVLPALLLDSLDPDELRYVLGREFGSIRFGHPRTGLLLGGDAVDQPALFRWVAQLRDLIFSWYRRVQVLSADRAGILACGSVRVAIRTEIKLAIGTAQLPEVEPADLIEQAFKLTQGASRLQAALIRLRTVRPPLIPRLEAIAAWAGLPERPQGPVSTREIDVPEHRLRL